MVNTRTKGNESVRQAAEYLSNLGYLVDKVERSSRFLKQKDLFGLFDLVALNPKKNPLFVQVKSNTPMPKRLLLEFSERFPNITCMCITRYDYQGLRIQTYQSGTLFEEDLRKSRRKIK